MADDEKVATTDVGQYQENKLQELQQAIIGADASRANALWRQYVNLYLTLQNHPEQQLQSSEDLTALAKEVTDSLGATVPGITASSTREQLEALVSAKESPSNDPSQRFVHHAAEPVMMFKGQFVHEVEDLKINGAGNKFVFKRTYKNQLTYNGPLGYNWDHSYNLWLRVSNETIFRTTGLLREDVYLRHPKFGQAGFNYWVPPDGQHGIIQENGSSYIFRAPDGERFIYGQSFSHPFLHHILRIEDKHGNYLAFSYQDDLIHTVEVNHSQRLIQFNYDEEHRIILIQDYVGRKWQYCYDDFGDLIGVITPPTDRYREGLATSYEYSSEQFTGELQHNLTRIIDPAGQMYLENEYGSEPNWLTYNRVMRQRQGDGERYFDYEDVSQEFEIDYSDAERPASQTTMVERNGHRMHYIYNKFGNLLLREEYVLQDGLLKLLRWRYRYNADGALIGVITPEGSVTQYYYGRADYLRRRDITDEEVKTDDQLTAQERMAFGNLLAVVKRGHRYDFATLDLSRGVWGNIFPDIIAAVDPLDIITKYTYEPDYQQMLTSSDPRYTQSADPTHPETPRYKETLTNYEYIGLQGDLHRIRRPEPTWPNNVRPGAVVEQFTDYDNRGRLKRYIDPVGTVKELSYFSSADGIREGYLQRIVIDPGGLAVTTEYEVDDLGRVTAVHRPRFVGAPAGHFVTRYEFNTLDQSIRTTVSPPFSYISRRFYDRNGNLEREERDTKDENGADIPGAPEVRTYRYDEQFNLLRETIGGQDLTAHFITRHRYDASDKRELTIRPNGNHMRYGYDERLQEVSRTIGAGTFEAATTHTVYDGDGRKRRSLNARGYPSTFTYDVFDRIIEQRDPLGNLIRRTYDKKGNLLVERIFEQESDGSYMLIARSEFEYDILNRQIRQGRSLFPDPLPVTSIDTDFLASPGPGHLLVTEAYHDAKSRLVRLVDPLGREHTYEYDALDRVTTEVDPDGNRTESHYDAHGNVVRNDIQELVRDARTGSVQGKLTFSSTRSYDELDRLITTTDSLGNTTRYTYDSRNNQVRRVDPLGNVRRYEYDIYGRRISKIQEMTTTGQGGSMPLTSVVVRFEYDPNGNLVGITDSLGRRTMQSFDALDRRRVIEFPDLSHTEFTYDPDANVIAIRDNNGLTRHYTVDPLGRTTRMDVDRSGLLAGLIVEGADFEAYEYDALGHQRREENDFIRYDIYVNSLGWAVQELLTFTTPAAPFTQTLKLVREFNDTGKLVGLTYPGGRFLHYTRNALDQVSQIENVTLGLAYPGSPVIANAHNIASFDYVGRQLSQSHLGNGATVAWHYDGDRRLIEIKHETAGREPLLTIQQLFDGAGNMRFRNDIMLTVNSGDAFRYDSLYRLTRSERRSDLPVFDPVKFAPASVSQPGSIPNGQKLIDALIGSLAQVPGDFTWAYDLAGNRQEERIPGHPSLIYTINSLDQYRTINGKALTYDRNGNLVNDGVHTYRYDSTNRLVRVSDPTTGTDLAQFFHDAQGRRILEISGGVTTHLVYNQLNTIAEYRSGVPFAQFIYTDGVDAVVQIASEGAEHWYHVDLVGSVRALTNSAGALAVSYSYTPFGIMIGDNHPYNPLRYMGRRFDERLDSYDFRTRQYDPALGRFTQRDTVGMTDGTNLYTYVGNNPLAFIDPLGTERQQVAKQTSLVNDMRRNLVAHAGDSSVGRFFLGAIGTVGSVVWEPTGWIADLIKIIPMKDDVNLHTYKPASDLVLKIMEEPDDMPLAENIKTRVHGTASLVTFGLIDALRNVQQLLSSSAEPEDRGAAFAQLGLSVWGGASLKSTFAGRIPPVVPDLITDPVLSAARNLRPGDPFPSEFQDVRWQPGDPPTYPDAKGQYPQWGVVRSRLQINTALNGNPLPADPITPYRGRVPIDHIEPQRLNQLDPHNMNNLWICDSYGWLEHAFFDVFAKGKDVTGKTWSGPGE